MSQLDDLVAATAHEFGLSRDLYAPHIGDRPRTTEQIAKLLGTVGYPCDSDANAAASLARIRARKYGVGGLKVAGTMTCRQGTPAVLRLICPDRLRNARLRFVARAIRPASSTIIDCQLEMRSARETWRLDFLPGCSELECNIPQLDEAPIGIYQIEIWEPNEDTPLRVKLFRAPEKCPRPKRRSWGYVAQLPTTRSPNNCGRGDFGDLIGFAEWMERYGGHYLGVTPFLLSEGHPYFNQSLLAYDWTQMSPRAAATLLGKTEVDAWLTTGDGRRRIEELRRSPTVDSEGVRALMRDVAHRLHEGFDQSDFPAHARHLMARPYLKALGVYLTQRSRELAKRDDGWDFRTWGALRCTTNPAISAFASEHRREVQFHAFVQWLAHSQLVEARDACRARGVSLYLDIPVSPAPGFDEWMWPQVFLSPLECGAPGDAFKLDGQTWGSLPRWLTGLRECGYEPFVLAVDEIMQLAGMARVDHFMIVQRIFAILRGGAPNDGAYLYGSLEEMLDIIVLLSHLNNCPVVGEDLGNVDLRVRKAMEDRGIYRMPIMMFEQAEDGVYNESSLYPEFAVTSWGSHDLPSPSQWLAGEDIYRATQLGHINAEKSAEQFGKRRRDIGKLLERLGRSDIGSPAAVTHDIYRFLANTAADVVMIHGEDLARGAWQPNVPGTSTGTQPGAYPNYGVMFPVPVAEIPGLMPELFTMMGSLRS